MKNLFVVLCCLFSGVSASGQEYVHLADFEVPKQFFADVDFHPAGYLNSYTVDGSSQLRPKDKLKEPLACLFIAASAAVVENYDQDYLISTSAPVYRLLVEQYRYLELEPVRSHVFLGDITSRLIEHEDQRAECWIEDGEKRAVVEE